MIVYSKYNVNDVVVSIALMCVLSIDNNSNRSISDLRAYVCV